MDQTVTLIHAPMLIFVVQMEYARVPFFQHPK